MSAETDPRVLELQKPDVTSRIFGLGRSRVRIPRILPETCLVRFLVGADGQRSGARLDGVREGDLVEGDPTDQWLVVWREWGEATLAWSRLHRDAGSGHAWDLAITGTLRVTDPVAFAAAAGHLAGYWTPLRRRAAASWLSDALRLALGDVLRDALQTEAFARLQDGTITPPGWWERRLEAGLGVQGLALTVQRVAWDSPEATRAAGAERERALAEEQRAAEVRERERLRQLAAEESRLRVEEARREAAMQTELAEVEADLAEHRAELAAERRARESGEALQGRTSEFQLRQFIEEQEGRIAALKQRRVEEQLEGERRIQALREASAAQSVEHEIRLAQLRADAEAARAHGLEQARARHEDASRLAREKDAACALRLQEIQARMEALGRDGRLARLDEELRHATTEAERERIRFEQEKQTLALDRERLLLERERDAALRDKERSDLELEKTRRQAEVETHRIDEARLKKAKAEVELEEAKKRSAEAGENQNRDRASLDELARVLASLKDVLGEGLRARLFGGDPARVYEAGAVLTSVGVSSEDLGRVGAVTPQQFIDRFPVQGLTLRKRHLASQELVVRSLGVRPLPGGSVPERVRVETVRIGDPVGFELSSPRSGYLTLLNPGTAGRFWLLAPNAYRNAPRIDKDRTFLVPGTEVMPEEDLSEAGMEFCENGPEGWEYLVAIVSDEPIVDAALLRCVDPQSPFAELSPPDLERLWTRLNHLGPDRWVAGTTRFYVVPR